MTYDTVSVIWETIQERFYHMVKELTDDELSYGVGNATIGYMIRHNAEVEYLFAEWYFGQELPMNMEIRTSRGPAGDPNTYTSIFEMLQLIRESQEHIGQAMRALPEQSWHVPVKSPMGTITPLQSVGRLLYHTSLHAGQIALLLKHTNPNSVSARKPKTVSTTLH
ncbi:DinB family protein [Paenibacillus alvei]|uniref:DinB family protein n=1 Tax=Paenibacillus alvei TaxID=44250 RepID=UPI003D2D641B